MTKKSGFKLKSGNSPMFKYMGSSPMDFKFGGKTYDSFNHYLQGLRDEHGVKDEETDGVDKKATRKAVRKQIGKDFQASKFRATLGKLFPNPLDLFSK